MARIITVCNNKGGVGKTTTALNFGAGLRLRGFNVLLIDYDGQCNLTESLRVPVAQDCHTYAAMTNRLTRYIQPVEVFPATDNAGNLSVLPAVPDLSALEVEMSQEQDRITRFSTVVEKYRDKYDYVIIDTPPTLGLLTLSALFAADEVITTVQPQYLAVRGLISVIDIIRQVEELKEFALPYSVLFTQFDKRKGLHRLTTDEVAAAGFPMFATKIRDNVALGEAPATGSDIFSYSPHSNGAADYNALVSEYLNRQY